MKPPFDVLILHGNGSRAMRFRLPRPVMYVSLGFVVLAMSATVGLFSRFAMLRSEAGELLSLRAELIAQQALLDSSQQRIMAVRGEIDSWRQLHAQMWAPYGPDGVASSIPSGVGGPRVDVTADSSESTTLGKELDLLTAAVTEESPRLRDLERMISKSARIMAALPLRWPARGPVNSEFGVRADPWDGAKEHHAGIDIGVAFGSAVKAPADGTVLLAGPRGEYGNSVTLDHGNDVRSLYGHLSRVLVKSGDHVEKGQVIGLVGSTGRSTGPHLHYEVQVKGRPVNPRSFLWG